MGMGKKKFVKECAVIATQADSYSVNFEGFGISIKEKPSFKIGDKVLIEYTGTIGKENFSYRATAVEPPCEMNEEVKSNE